MRTNFWDGKADNIKKSYLPDVPFTPEQRRLELAIEYIKKNSSENDRWRADRRNCHDRAWRRK